MGIRGSKKEGQLQDGKLLGGAVLHNRIYKSIFFLSFLNKKRRYGVDRNLIHELHEESIARMLDLLQNGTESQVLFKNPL